MVNSLFVPRTRPALDSVPPTKILLILKEDQRRVQFTMQTKTDLLGSTTLRATTTPDFMIFFKTPEIPLADPTRDLVVAAAALAVVVVGYLALTVA